jgi:hypothetical protein
MNATDAVSKFVPVRIIVVAVAIWMTWLASDWSMWFATGNARPGIEIAAIIAAVTSPIAVFGAYVFKAYIESRVV